MRVIMRSMQIFRKALSVFACAMPLVLLCLCGGMLPMAGAILIHECAHLAVLRLLGGRVRAFHTAPFGLCIEYDENTLSLRGEIFVTAAGCLANLLTAALCICLYATVRFDLLFFGIVNAGVCCMNLLPILPLDGARILLLCLAMRFSPDSAERAVGYVTHGCSFCLFLLSSYLLLSGQAGVYPLLFTAYIFAANAQRLSKSVF